MKKTMILMAACLVAGTAAAQESPVDDWGANWFLSAKGGVSAFIGKPVGHGDLFDREKPLLNVSVGKWFTPHVAGRLAFQGLQLKDANMVSCNYQNLHVDFLYNLTAHSDGMQKWDIIPYAGCGLIHNSYNGQKPFAISYGLIGRYRLSERLHLSGELGATTTWQNFDGQGASDKLGDHLLQASIGLSVTIGKVGWKKSRVHEVDLNQVNRYYDSWQNQNKGTAPSAQSTAAHERNNYSGLNSLRKRLANKDWDGISDTINVDSLADSTAIAVNKYLHILKSGKKYIGAPIYFFFKIGTHELTENAQFINIKEVSEVIKRYGLQARIIGAADSETGTPEINERLSVERADYIAGLLKAHGVDETHIQKKHRGGIDSYEPLNGNRNTCVVLYFK